MALKINITLDSYEDHKLLVEAITNYRAQILVESQVENIAPAQNAELVHIARQLYMLKEKVTQ
jgi:hypothetical protein